MLSLIGRLVSLALLATIIVSGLVVAGTGFMVMLPALCLVAPLLLGRYVGEQRIYRIRKALAAKRLRLKREAVPAALRGGHGLPFRGGRLIAASLAVRPPPLPA